jgi:hypothetical protein
MYLKSEKHAIDFVIHVIKTWQTPVQDCEELKVLGYCCINTISLYHVMKHKMYNIENHNWIKYGSIQSKEKSKTVKVNGIHYNPFHYWIEIDINGKLIVLDISKIFIDYFRKTDLELLNKEYKRMCGEMGDEMYWKNFSNEFIYNEKTDGYLFDREKGFIIQKSDDPNVIVEIVSTLKMLSK